MHKPYAITFLYYEDIHAIAPFYTSVMGFDLVLDQGLAQIFRAAPGNFLGIVDGNQGHLRQQEQSAVLFTIVDDDVEGWHARLAKAGVSGLTEILHGRYCDHFFFRTRRAMLWRCSDSGIRKSQRCSASDPLHPRCPIGMEWDSCIWVNSFHIRLRGTTFCPDMATLGDRKVEQGDSRTVSRWSSPRYCPASTGQGTSSSGRGAASIHVYQPVWKHSPRQFPRHDPGRRLRTEPLRLLQHELRRVEMTRRPCPGPVRWHVGPGP